MRRDYVIAIDGPAASGKSTTARELAKEFAYVYIDTGAMYRACALKFLQDNIDINNEKDLRKMLGNIDIKIEYSPEGNHIYLDSVDVSQRIRQADITRLSSEIAVIGIVREKMVELQRKMGERGGVIMDGRDIGTVVFPHADFKFFMVATPSARARRRWLEAKEKGETLELEDIENELLWRDKNDSTRSHSPLKKAEDAIEIDTSGLTIAQQTKKIENYIRKVEDAV